MFQMNFNPKAKRVPVAKGTYPFVITESEITESKKGNQCLKVTFVGMAGEVEDKTIRKWFVLPTGEEEDDGRGRRAVALFDAAGIDYDYDEDAGTLAFEESDLVDKQVLARVFWEKQVYEGRKEDREQVTDFAPMSDEGEAVEESGEPESAEDAQEPAPEQPKKEKASAAAAPKNGGAKAAPAAKAAPSAAKAGRKPLNLA